jgi:hypothetical protein
VRGRAFFVTSQRSTIFLGIEVAGMSVPPPLETLMRPYFRWASLLAAVGGLTFLFRRTRRERKVDPNTLGPVSDQWFMDRRHDL